MKTPSFLMGNDFISIAVNNTPYTLYKGDARFPKVLEIIKARAWDKLEDALNTARAVAKFAAGNIQVFDGAVLYKDKQIHNTVVNKILEFMAQGFPYEPLVRFLDKLMENPSNRSVEQLYNYLELYKMPITDEGNILAAKAVTSDFKDKWTGKIDNSVGANPKMNRNEVSDDHNVACGPGLHHGWYQFVSSYGSGDDRAILTEFSPKDVVRIPHDSSYQKIVVCEYKVLKDLGPVKDLKDFDSSYAPETEQAEDLYNFDNDYEDVSQLGEDIDSGDDIYTPTEVNVCVNGEEMKTTAMVNHANNTALVVKNTPMRDAKGRFIKQATQKMEDYHG